MTLCGWSVGAFLLAVLAFDEHGFRVVVFSVRGNSKFLGSVRVSLGVGEEWLAQISIPGTVFRTLWSERALPRSFTHFGELLRDIRWLAMGTLIVVINAWRRTFFGEQSLKEAHVL
jgi:hypothetical protein